jgi:hypothetical protein
VPLGVFAAHDTATAAGGNTDMDATDGHYGESAHAASASMNSQQCIGTGQLPLARAILCCTALPHEQRVGRPYFPYAQVTNML